ncbi:ABC transporter permease [Zavarzinella formosa]|uniref:ABC transporter permease n=1 Tax=Zavarzinella formosa TaxID=360055 RepID=UPI000307BD68|nr:ABC transporter permease [Zavarzinella formosa]
MLTELVKFRRNTILAIRGLWLHKLRAFLSVLGIIIGIASVIALLAFGKGSMQEALDAIKRQGATNIIARSQKPPDDSATGSRSFVATYGLTFRDYEKFENISVLNRLVPMRVFPREIRRLERMHNGRVVATTPEYMEVNRLEMASGRFLVQQDGILMRNVVVLGSVSADRLFPFDNPLDQTIVLAGQDFQVIGVLKDRMPTGGSGGSQAAEDFNSDVYMPLPTSRRRVGDTIFIRTSGSRGAEKVEISQVTMTVDADVDSREGRQKVKAVGDLVKQILEEGHLKRDFAITIPLDRLEQAEETEQNFKNLLVLIASISLLVGGIGIMNIMLATVTERTREIGIRRALGAKRKDIVLQFLVEAVVQTTIGGILGIGAGIAIAYGVPFASSVFGYRPIPSAPQWDSMIYSFFVSSGIGVLFGLYPAWRAARLDPIEALRHD